MITLHRHLWRFCAALAVALVFQPAVAVGETEPNLQNGQRAFATCANCHTLHEGGDHIYGPNLHGVFGRPIGSVPGYEYSESLSNAEGVWDEDALNRYIARPKLARPGNEMPYQGLLSPHARADMIAWLKTNPGEFKGADNDIDTLVELAAPDAGLPHVRACLVCHEASEGAGHKIGPNLWGVVGREVGSAPGFDYSEDLSRRSGTWTPQTLEAFFTEQKQFRQGSHLAFRQLRIREDRAAVIAWLKTRSNGDYKY